MSVPTATTATSGPVQVHCGCSLCRRGLIVQAGDKKGHRWFLLCQRCRSSQCKVRPAGGATERAGCFFKFDKYHLGSITMSYVSEVNWSTPTTTPKRKKKRSGLSDGDQEHPRRINEPSTTKNLIRSHSLTNHYFVITHNYSTSY